MDTAKKPKSIVEIKGNGGMISGHVNPTHFIHVDNRKPFGIVESIKLVGKISDKRVDKLLCPRWGS